MKSHVLIFVGCLPLAVALWPFSLGALSAQEPTGSDVVLWLRQQEKLIHTVDVELVERLSPTPFNDVRRIKEALVGQGMNESAQKVMLTEAQAKQSAHKKRWLFDGAQEYCETYPDATGHGHPNVYASDGKLYKWLGYRKGVLTGMLSTPQKQHMYDSDRVTPLSLLYYSVSEPLSDIVETARHFEVKRGELPDYWMVDVWRSEKTPWRFVFLFDDLHRVSRRDVYALGEAVTARGLGSTAALT